MMRRQTLNHGGHGGITGKALAKTMEWLPL